MGPFIVCSTLFRLALPLFELSQPNARCTSSNCVRAQNISEERMEEISHKTQRACQVRIFLVIYNQPLKFVLGFSMNNALLRNPHQKSVEGANWHATVVLLASALLGKLTNLGARGD